MGCDLCDFFTIFWQITFDGHACLHTDGFDSGYVCQNQVKCFTFLMVIVNFLSDM